jgi:Tol biopolymer transport system component
MTLRTLCLLALVSTVPTVASAQYFGQNRVMYTTFDFEIIHTKHFDIYFYPREREASLDAARMAERSYGRLSTLLNHQFIERKPIILYASHSDFQQTNALGGDIGEATGGVTDFMKHRAIMPFTGAYKDFDHVLMHEMVHQFQYDTWSHGKAGSGVATIIQVNPPLWFAEGMAEYLSLGEITPETAMWLRDAVLQGKLPTIQQLTYDPYIFPYRFGHALWAYIGMRWGDEAVGAILSATLGGGGVEGAFQRVLGITLAQLSVQWRDWVQTTYLPDVAARQLASAVGKPLLTQDISGGTLHVAPALSPDGKQIAYLSERNFFFIDFYLADGETGKVIKRLAKSVFDANYETFRYLSSSASWSPDSKYLVFAAKAKDYDNIVVFDPRRSKAVRRIHVPLNGITSPVFSPDGKQLAFSGQNGGISDLFVVNVDGSGLRQLTNDKYAQLMPAWSPDGHTIAYVTDEGPETNFTDLAFGNLRVALFDVDLGRRELLPHMESGRNISPQWAPDGKSFAFVSDRTGIANIYIYELGGDIYQITNLFTGAQSATPLSPALSWARDADRLAFVYFENLNNDVYTIQNPRGLMREPWRPPEAPPEAAPVAVRTDSAPAVTPDARPAPQAPAAVAAVPPPAPRPDSAAANPVPGVPQVKEGGSIYRTPTGFRAAAQAPVVTDTAGRRLSDVTVVGLLDSASLFLPDTNSFSIGPYKRKFTPETTARPSVGYTRDNFGNGIYGGGAIQFGDMLGNEQLIFAGYINGSLNQGDFLAAYANLGHRINWAVGFQQTPTYFVLQPVVIAGSPTPAENRYVTSTRLITSRNIFGRAYYNISRFQRLEMGLSLGQWDDAILSYVETYDRVSGVQTADPFSETFYSDGQRAMTPSVALVYDATFMGWIGPLFGTRYRLEVAQTMGDWNVSQLLADYRKYIPLKGPIILAARALYSGRRGPDAGQVTYFLGSTDLVRGRTSGSYYRYECTTTSGGINSVTGCRALDQMVGTEIAVGNLEIRFPVVNSYLGIGPQGLPYVDGVAWIDYGVAWNSYNTVAFKVDPNASPAKQLETRVPVTTIGFGLRMNLFGYLILRGDFSYPQGRGIPPYWTISIGPPF